MSEVYMGVISRVWQIDVITHGHYLELGRGSGKWGGAQRHGGMSGFVLVIARYSFYSFSRHLLGTSYVIGTVLGAGHLEWRKTLFLPSGMRRTIKKTEEAL